MSIAIWVEPPRTLTVANLSTQGKLNSRDETATETRVKRLEVMQSGPAFNHRAKRNPHPRMWSSQKEYRQIPRQGTDSPTRLAKTPLETRGRPWASSTKMMKFKSSSSGMRHCRAAQRGRENAPRVRRGADVSGPCGQSRCPHLFIRKPVGTDN